MAETLNQGVVIPQPADVIDSTGVAAMRQMGSSVNTALTSRVRAERLDPTNLNTVKEPGFYVLPAPYPTGFTNVPTENITASVMIVGGSAGGTWAFQEIVQYGANQRRWWRMSRTQTLWNDWVEIGAGGGGDVDYFTAPPPSASHEMRVRAFKDAYPLVSTGDKGAVVLRFDHGLTNFKSTLWPLLQQYSVKAYIAMNSRLWSIAENSGASQSDAQSWIASGLVEFGNHTSDHADRNTAAGIYDTIVNGRKELESQLGTTIHGFTVPGLTEYNKFEGFNNGTLDTYSETYAGGLILANHAICSGAIGASMRTLDGQVRQGGRHYTWESAAWNSIKTQIDNAIASKSALTLMCHPRTMGGSNWSPALAEQVISYIREQIDADNLADISYYQSHHAQLAPLV